MLERLQDLAWQEWVLFAMAPFFVGFYIWEWVKARQAGRAESFTIKRALLNFSLGASYLTFDFIAKLFVILPFCAWVYTHRIFTIEVTMVSFIPLFILSEFCYYWFHRASHRVRWFWTAHVVHHSDEAMNLSTAMRQSVLYTVTGWWLFFVPMIILGVSPAWTFFFYALNLIYQFFIHTEAIGKLPRWAEFIFDTPSNHRAHHGRNPQYIDKNYGGVLIIFDRLFGTYVEEKEVVDYGVIPAEKSFNIFRVIFFEFFMMCQDVWQAKTAKERWRQLFSPPAHSMHYRKQRRTTK